MTIIRDRIDLAELVALAEGRFGDLVKAVVDVERGIMAVGSELHADDEAALLDDGSRLVRSGVTEPQFTDFVKSTYRVLLTRGLRGCYLYFMDAPTRDLVLSRIERVAMLAPRAAEVVDAAVFATYGWPADLPDTGIPERLLTLNLERAG